MNRKAIRSELSKITRSLEKIRGFLNEGETKIKGGANIPLDEVLSSEYSHKKTVISSLRSAGVLTLKELSLRTENQIKLVSGIGSTAMEYLRGELGRYGLKFKK